MAEPADDFSVDAAHQTVPLSMEGEMPPMESSTGAPDEEDELDDLFVELIEE